LCYIDGREFKINNEAGNIIPPDFRKTISNFGITRDNSTGDLIIIFNIIYPKTITEKQIKELSNIL
jgi:DnaJ-class molecular chaperone with C-terminal Zn finger domain